MLFNRKVGYFLILTLKSDFVLLDSVVFHISQMLLPDDLIPVQTVGTQYKQ